MKALLGIDFNGSYTFDPATNKVTFKNLDDAISLSNILVITNVTANTVIYNFASSTKGAVSFNGTELVLDYNTSSMNANDQLQIYLDVKHEGNSLLRRILSALLAPLGYDKLIQRFRNTAIVESGTLTTCSTVTSVTTCSTASNLVNLNGLPADRLIFGQNFAAWAATNRARIT